MQELTETYLINTFRRLKKHYYFDYYNFTNRLLISEFESKLSPKRTRRLVSEFSSILNGEANSAYQNWIDQIDIEFRFKKELIGTGDSGYAIEPKAEGSSKIDKFVGVIRAPVELLLLDILWIDESGHKMDSTLSTSVRGNRLHRTGGLYSPDQEQVFAPYYLNYRSWRDNAIRTARDLNRQKKSCTILTYDITEFFNSIDPRKEVSSSSALDVILSDIYLAFADKRNKYFDTPQNATLPIGLLSSPILANWSLKEFDNSVWDSGHCRYYGRYVDDLIFVIEGDKSIAESFESSLFERNSDGRNNLKSVDHVFTVNANKIKRLHFSSKTPAVELDAYIRELNIQSSEYRLLADFPNNGTELHLNSIELTFDGSISTFRSISGVDYSKNKVSRALSGAIRALSTTNVIQGKEADKYSSSIFTIGQQGNLVDRLIVAEKVLCCLSLLNNTSKIAKYVDGLLQDVMLAETPEESKVSGNLLENAKITHALDLLVALAMSVTVKTPFRVEKLDAQISIILRNQGISSNRRLRSYTLDGFRKSIAGANMYRNNLPAISISSYYRVGVSRFRNDFETIREIEKRKLDLSPRFVHFHERYFNEVMLALNGKRPRKKYEHLLKEQLESYLAASRLDTSKGGSISVESTPQKTHVRVVPAKKIDTLRIGVAHITTSAVDSTKGLTGTSNLSISRYKRLKSILDESIRDKCDVLVFPEISIPFEWYGILAEFSKRNQIMLIGGFEHFKTLSSRPVNLVFNFIPFKVGSYRSVVPILRPKIHYSPEESSIISKINGLGPPIRGSKLITVEYGDMHYTVFNCFELANIRLRSSLLGVVNTIFAVEYNSDTEYFRNVTHALSRDLHCLVVQVNAKDIGDTLVVAPFKQEQRDILVLSKGLSEHVHAIQFDFKSHNAFLQTGKPEEVHLPYKTGTFKPIPPGFKRRFS